MIHRHAGAANYSYKEETSDLEKKSGTDAHPCMALLAVQQRYFIHDIIIPTCHC